MYSLSLDDNISYKLNDGKVEISSEKPILIDDPEKEVAFLIGSLLRKCYYSEDYPPKSKTMDELNKFNGTYASLIKLYEFILGRCEEKNWNIVGITSIIDSNLNQIKDWGLNRPETKYYVTFGQTIKQRK
jgi:hypothetical protein